MRSADEFKSIKAVTLSTAGHVFDQFGVSGFLAFDFRELPRHVVKLHGLNFLNRSHYCSRLQPVWMQLLKNLSKVTAESSALILMIVVSCLVCIYRMPLLQGDSRNS